MYAINNKKQFYISIVCIFIGVLLGRFTIGGFFWAIVLGPSAAIILDAIFGK